MDTEPTSTIKALDGKSVHKITSGQVVVDLQTAIKELVENSLDAGATNIEVRCKNYGLKSVEFIDNGCGIAPEDYDSVALKHHTSKLSTFEDLSTVCTFGFRGEALSSLCALSQSVSITTATAQQAPMGTVLQIEKSGMVGRKDARVARQQGTTVLLTGLFNSLPVRRKELERNVKREYGKALNLLHAYALVPCAQENNGVRLSVSNQPDGGQKSFQIRTNGALSIRASVSALWGPKALDNVTDLDLIFTVETEKYVLRRTANGTDSDNSNEVRVKGLVSKFQPGCGRTATDRQFFFINGRPCNPSKVQKAFNELYRSFNPNQSPFIVADFILPTNSCDINVSPDKRTILLHSEGNLILALKKSLEETFALLRSTYDVDIGRTQTQTQISLRKPPVHKQQTTVEDERSSSSQAPRSCDAQTHSHHTPERAAPTPSDEDKSMHLAMTEDSQSSESTIVASIPSIHDATSHETHEASQKTVVEETEQMHYSFITNLVRDADGTSKTMTTQADEKDVVMSTQKTAWSRSLRRTNEDDGEDVGQPRKKRRSDATPEVVEDGSKEERRQTDMDTPVGKKVAERPPSYQEARQNLRSQLSGFARAGSQVASQTLFEREDSDEEDAHPIDDDAMVDELDPDVPEEENRMELDEPRGQGDESGDAEPALGTDSRTFVERKSSTLSPRKPVADEDEVIDITADIDYDSSANEMNLMTLSSNSYDEIVRRPEVIRTMDGDGDNVSLRFDLSRISKIWYRLQEKQPASGLIPESRAAVPTEASISNEDDEQAAEALTRIIDKDDFGRMQVIGQFNLGFIVVRRRKQLSDQPGETSATDDLFIVDQHAADEKFNFESLQRTTVIESQKLLRARSLELTAADEMLATENLDVLRQNGFEVDVDDDQDIAPGESRLKLVAQPVSKSTVFDMKDLEEIIQLMRDRPKGQMVRCSKARAMFAMRACRKSIMVGMPLNKKQMLSVVQHMGTMEQPWNCPHGRPTMRHLFDLGDVGRKDDDVRAINWAAFKEI